MTATFLLGLQWLKCVCLIGLDVTPTWYKDRKFQRLSLWITVLLVCDVLRLGLPPGGTSSPFSFSLYIIFHRLTTRTFTRQWAKLLLRQVSPLTGSPGRSFLSVPKTLQDVLETVMDGGPLGHGCAKLADVFFGLLLLLSAEKVMEIPQFETWSNFCAIGPLWPNIWLPIVVLMFCLVTNLVLWLWSTAEKKSRGVHTGVNRMVEKTLDRALHLPEHLMVFAWAFWNALSEEVTGRGFRRWEFSLLVPQVSPKRGSINPFPPSNILQALSFGLSHFYGVPNGWPGVVLTFIYGWVMGLIQDAGGGLLYPIVAHTIADYFIFSQIARRKQGRKQ